MILVIFILNIKSKQIKESTVNNAKSNRERSSISKDLLPTRKTGNKNAGERCTLKWLLTFETGWAITPQLVPDSLRS